MSMSGSRRRTFMDLKGAVLSGHKQVSLFAVVTEIGRPRKSKGTDYVCTLHIIDNSFQAGISVNFFAYCKANLPHAMSTGDIIRLDDVEIRYHDKDVFAVFKKTVSCFALFRGKSNGFVPYQSSSQFRRLDHDEEFIAKLRTWWDSYQFDSGVDEYALLLREIKEGSYFDLLCKVCHVVKVSEVDTILFVWDGTDTPAVPADAKMNYDLQAEIFLPIQVEDFSLPRSVSRAFPQLGSILSITSGEEFKDLWGYLRGTRRWVKFRNIQCQLQSGLWKCATVPSSRVCFLSDNDTNVINRERVYNERVSNPLAWMPNSCPSIPSQITVTNHEKEKLSTLRKVINYSEAVHRFRCIVRVIEIFPFSAERFRKPQEPHEYAIRLTLEDPTARLYAFVSNKDALDFFGDYHPADILTSKMKKLLGWGESNSVGDVSDATSRNAPWIDCCIKSYYVDKSDIWGSRHFKIFGTTLIV